MKAARKLGAGFDPAPLRVGGTTLAGRAFLAPMAGVTDPAMRSIAEDYGASVTVSEMITAAGVAKGDRETRMRLSGQAKGPRVVQIAACDAEGVAAAARFARESGADWIDINMGCPCKRVTGGLAGAALMRDPDHAARLAGAAVAAVDVPVSVKMRLGWDDASRNAPDLARKLEAEGVAALTVHGRTRQQFYTGRADWAAIAAVKQAVGIPVVANGDCAGEEDAAEMLRLSGADAVMIGRAAQGRPWLVGDIAHYLLTGEKRPQPGRAERGAVALRHFEGLLALMGEAAGLRHARKHLASYAEHAGLCGAQGEGRRALVTAETPGDVRRAIETLFFGEGREEAA